ncbi:MAG: response regulator [Emcibacteraceae bacterium]|nr:response regulator [Emcibacteraceae bacterium]
MNKSGRDISFDYSYFISVGGIGGLFSIASLMFGFAYGLPVYGYYAASVILLLTGVILLRLLKNAKSVHASILQQASVYKNENVGVAMLMTSPAGDVVYANNAAKILFEKYEFGVPQSPLKIDVSNKNTIENILDTLVVGNIKIVVVEIRESGKYLKLELEKVQKNGNFYSWRIFEDAKVDNLYNIENSGPDYHASIGQFFENSDIGFFAINENDKITYLNNIFLKLLFEEGDAPEVPSDLSLISHHSQSNLKDKVEFISASGKKLATHVKIWNGTSKVDMTGYLVVLDNSSISNGERRELETGAENSFFWSSPIGIAVVNNKGIIHDKNIIFSNFIAALELEKHENIADILTPENATEVFKEINKTLNSGKPSMKVDLVLQGGSDKQGQFYITNIGEQKQDNDEVIIYLIDITEQKSLELQFSQSQKMQAVGQLAGGIAHDFNNLLTAITGFCDLLLIKHGPGDQSFSDIIQIKQNANRAANLVRQLLAFSRQQTLRPKILIMTDVVAELSNLLRRLIGSNIELEMNHGRDINPVRVDQGQLEQVIINLCVNARDAMPDGGKLVIKTCNVGMEESIKIGKIHQIFPKGEYVLLEVTDNGTGIAKEHQEKVFEPFFSTKDVGKGTGLGLSTVYGIIKQTDGYVFLDSEVGLGTSFKIYLPQHVMGEVEEVETAIDIIKDKEPARDLTGNSTILLVEDEDAVRMFASRALKNKGYTVYEADSGVTALQVMAEVETQIDLIISDVMMPQMDGPTLVKKIRETDTELKVIFISGYAEDALDDNITDKDFNFLSKPFSLKQLVEQVKEVLEK